jgi:hypothetical protein
VGVLSDVAVARAVEGRSDDARELLELAFRGPSLVEDWPWTMAFLTWQFGVRRALHGLERTLPSLPHDADLTSIEAQLSAVNVEAGLVRAFQGERAFGNDMFDALFDGRYAGDESPPAIDGLTGMLLWAWRGNDRVFYLETMTAGIGWARQPYYLAAPAMASSREWAEKSATMNLCIVSVMLLPRMDAYIEGANETRAHIALARAVLLARREGAEAAMAFARATPDPFRDGPLQWRIDEDGVLVLWSVGADLVDQGGRDAWNEDDEGFGWQQVPPDIVWRVMPR